jgi:hypothetical protein
MGRRAAVPGEATGRDPLGRPGVKRVPCRRTPQEPTSTARLFIMQEREYQTNPAIPRKGDRIESLRLRTGVRPRGTVYYADDLQILVKWDNGHSESLRPGVDPFRIVAGD